MENRENWLLAQWLLATWDPNRLNFITDKRRRDSRRLFYRTNGIVLHDRALNGQKLIKECTKDSHENA